jgi:guanylate kinase
MTRYKIYFGASRPGEPGPGDWTDGIGPYEYDYTGDDPESEAKRLRWESYKEQGILPDLAYWYEEIKDVKDIKDKRLVIVSGPSGAGKGPIIEWTKKLYLPDLCQVKVRKTKTERHSGNEDDIGFEDNVGKYHQFDCRGVEQRIYLDELDSALEKHDIVLLESYYKTHDFLKGRYDSSIDFVSVFVSPLDIKEIKELDEQGKNISKYLPELMLDSLVRRAEREGKIFTRSLNKELEQRAEDSINEIKAAHNYNLVIPNHCYESDSRWKFPILIGEPGKVVASLKDIINTGYSDYAFNGKDFDLFQK